MDRGLYVAKGVVMDKGIRTCQALKLFTLAAKIVAGQLRVSGSRSHTAKITFIKSRRSLSSNWVWYRFE